MPLLHTVRKILAATAVVLPVFGISVPVDASDTLSSELPQSKAEQKTYVCDTVFSPFENPRLAAELRLDAPDGYLISAAVNHPWNPLSLLCSRADSLPTDNDGNAKEDGTSIGHVISEDGPELIAASIDEDGELAAIDSFYLTSESTVLVENTDVAVQGAGFVPFSTVEVWLHSDPILLGEIDTDANGVFSAVLPLPENIVLGDHTIKTVGTAEEEVTLSLPVTIVAAGPYIPSPAPATLTLVGSAIEIDYSADDIWLRVNGEWITSNLVDPIELVPGDTLTAQVRNCEGEFCSKWIYSSYTLEIAAQPLSPTFDFVTSDGTSGLLTVSADAEEIVVSVNGEIIEGLSVTLTESATIEVAARNCGGLPICSDWVVANYSIEKAETPEAATISFVSVDALTGTLVVDSEGDETVITLNGSKAEALDVAAGDILVVETRNCLDLCSAWVASDYEVSEAPLPEAPSIEFESLSPYTGQLEIDFVADEVAAALNGEEVIADIVAVKGGDILEMQIRNCNGADVCSAWVTGEHTVSVDGAPEAPQVSFVSTGPWTGELGYTATGDEIVATFNGIEVELQNFAVYGGETLAVQARNCLDAEICSEWVTDEHTVTVAPAPSAAGLVYADGSILFSYIADEVEVSLNGADYEVVTGIVSRSVAIDDELDVRVRNCDDYDICSVWVDSNYLVTQADEPSAASIVFDATDSYTGELVVTHGADEAVMTLDGEVVSEPIIAVGHQKLIVNIRDCDGYDECSEWVTSTYTVSVASTPEAANITFARDGDFAGELTVSHSAEEQILDLDGDTAVISPVAVIGLETLEVNIRNCADADVCSPWVETTRGVTVAPVPAAPTIHFDTTGDYSRDLNAAVNADKYEAILDGTATPLPVEVFGGETLVVEAWNCDGYDICSDRTASADSHNVSVASTPDAAILTYNNGRIDIDHTANQMELSTDGGITYNASSAVSWGVDVGDTLDIRVRNCGGYDICSVWADSNYLVTQAPASASATFTFSLTGDYSADVTIDDKGAENISITVDGVAHNDLTVPVTGGEVIEVSVWDCDNYDVCSEPTVSTYTVDVATAPAAAEINFSASSDGTEGTLSLNQGIAEEMRQWFNNVSTTDITWTVSGGETLLAEVRNCGTNQQICSQWIESTYFVSTDDDAAAAILTFAKVDDDNGTITVAHGTDEISLSLDGAPTSGTVISVTAGQTLVAQTRNCVDAHICSAWTTTSYTVSVATKPAVPTFTYNSTNSYEGTVSVNTADFQDRMEVTLTRDGVNSSMSLDDAVIAGDSIEVSVRGCDDGDLCSEWSTATYAVSEAGTTNTPTFSATRIGGNFDSVSTSITVDFGTGTVEEFQIFADSTSGTLLSDSSATVTIAKTDGYSSIVARSRNCSGSDVCSPWVPATMNVTTRANPAAPSITLDENGFVVSALGEFDRSSFNEAAFVEASGNLTSVPAGENDTLTVETRNCGDVNTWTFCSDVMSVGPALYVPAPEAATLTWDTSDYLLEVDFDATHIKIETGNGSTIYVTETTYTKAAFEAAHPNGINCRPGWLWTWQLRDCFVDIEVWNESGSYGSLAVPSDRFIVNEAAGVVGPPFTFNIDVETGEVLSVVPRVTPNNADIITNFSGGGLTLAGPFTCEDDWTCPALFDSIVGNSYPAGATFNFLVESWTDGNNDVHLPQLYNQIVYVQKTSTPTSVFDTLTAGSTGISQPYSGTPAFQWNTATNGTYMFEYSVDGGSNWVSLPDVTGGTINTNLTVDYGVLYPGGVPVPSLDFRARYCAGSNSVQYIFLCGDWSDVKSYTQGELTADNPDELVLAKHTSWSTGGGTLTTTGTVADTTQYRVDTGAWTTTSFGSVNTPGLYQTRQQNCGMAAGGCSSGGTNVFPSEWVESELQITKAPTPTVALTPGVNPGYGGTNNTCLELHVNGESVQWYQAAYGGASYSLDGGSTTTPVSWTGPCYGAFADGDEVIAYARDYAGYADGTYDLPSDETASAPYTVTKADDPEVTVDVDPLTGATTLSSPTGSDVTLSYAVNGYTYTDYTTGDSFTVAADDVLRIKAYNCPVGKDLCGFTYEAITITQAGTVPAAWLLFDVTGGSNDFAFMYLGSDPNYILTSFKVNSVEYVTEPVACVAEPSGYDPNTCLTDLDTTLGFGELMPGDALDYTLYNLGDAHLAGNATTSSVTLGAHKRESSNLNFGSAGTTADGFSQTLSGGWQYSSGMNMTLYGAFQYSTDNTNWTALPIVSTTTSSLADFVAEVPNSVLHNNGNLIDNLHIRFRTCLSQDSSGYTLNLVNSDYGLCKDWRTISYTQADLTPPAPGSSPSLAWDNDAQTITISNAADEVQYSTDGTNWTETAFGTITTPGTYYVRHRICGTANDASCATGGMNVYPSAWESASYTVTQAAQPTVSITVDQSTEEATIAASAGTVTYDIDGGTASAYTAPFAVTADTTVNAAAQDCSLDLCSAVGIASLYISKNSDPALSISIDQNTGVTTVSAGTSTNTTYDIGSGATTYTAPFTVSAGTVLTVNAIDCSGILCSGTSTINKTVTQAVAPTVTVSVDNESGEVSITSPSATEIFYNTGSGDVAYTTPFTPADGTTVTARARNCSTDLCSPEGTDNLTVTYGATPTVTIAMDDSGNLVVATDSATVNTEIRYGWVTGDTTNTYSTALTTSDYSFGDTLYVKARSIDGGNVWSSWSAEQSFNTLPAAPATAPEIDNNADFSELTFTASANDIEYWVHTSYDTSTQTVGWTEGTSVTIRNGNIDHGDFGYTSDTGQLVDVSARARNCANVAVESSCSAWVTEMNVTYGSEYVTNIGDSDDGLDTVAAANGEITFRMRFECAFDRCMPISNIQWNYEADTDPVANSNNWEYTDTFQIDRVNPGTYVTPTSSVDFWTTAGHFVAAAGYSVVTGQTAHWGTTTVVDTSGTVDLPVATQRLKRLNFYARWSGSPAAAYDDKWPGTLSHVFDGSYTW